MIEVGPVFRKVRATAFSCIIVVSLTWIVLLSLELNLRWDVSDPVQRSLVATMILVDAITAILLPALLIVEFRAWLDTARLLFLLLAHFGTAIGFALRNPTYQCPEDTPDDNGVCRLLNMYILLGSWVIPALLVAYAICLALAVYLHSRRARCQSFTEKSSDLEEATTPTQAELPIMSPPRSQRGSSNTLLFAANNDLSGPSRPSWLASVPAASHSSVSLTLSVRGPDADSGSKKEKSSRSSARLSKRLPERYF